MTLGARGGLIWVGMILAGLALGAYVYAAWPDSEALQKTPSAKSQPVRATASVDAYSELAGVAGAAYPDELFAYELGPTPFLEAVIAAPPVPDVE